MKQEFLNSKIKVGSFVSRDQEKGISLYYTYRKITENEKERSERDF